MKTKVVLACGALAKEITTLIDLNGWRHLKLTCLPAKLHNRPELIAPAVERKISQLKKDGYEDIFVAYGDCGTGGQLDRVLEKTGASRLAGAHCYAFFSGLDTFERLSEDALGTFYLTDFLAQHFDRLILSELGIKQHPELLSMYFGNYTKLVYLAQTENAALCQKARAAAEALGLQYVYRFTGYGNLQSELQHYATELHPIVMHKQIGSA